MPIKKNAIRDVWGDQENSLPLSDSQLPIAEIPNLGGVLRFIAASDTPTVLEMPPGSWKPTHERYWSPVETSTSASWLSAGAARTRLCRDFPASNFQEGPLGGGECGLVGDLQSTEL